jgi:hypothetical protein
MLLYRPFLVHVSRSTQRQVPSLEDAALQCVEAAKETIEIIHGTYLHHTFFRTWYYNTTYTLFAVSVILFYAFQAAPTSKKPALFALVDKAVEVLEAMDDCVVAGKAAEIVKHTLANARDLAVFPRYGTDHAQPMREQARLLDGADHFPPEDVFASIYTDMNFEFDLGSLGMDDTQNLFSFDMGQEVYT